MSRELVLLEKLENDLSLKQVQIKSLLNITQAINENISISDLFSMFESFLRWEMDVHKMVFLMNDGGNWTCESSIKSDGPALIEKGIVEEALTVKRLTTVKNKDFKILCEFDIVVPVYHKSQPLSYAIIGGMKREEDLYDKLQFITTITNIVTVAIENKRLFKQQILQERYKKEIELASEVQKMLIPEELPKGDFFEISSIYKPHYNVGGDYIDFIHLPNNNFLLCIADISGKGVSAALLMANFQAVISSLVNKHDDLHSFVQDINRSVFKITKGDKFLTFFIARVEKHRNRIQYVNAGHYPPFAVSDNGIQSLTKGCTVIGAFEELPFIEIGELEMEEEMLLFTFTDGLTDVMDKNGNYFDESLLSAFLSKNWKLPAEKINKALMKEINRFKGKEVFPDDIAVLTCKFFKDE